MLIHGNLPQDFKVFVRWRHRTQHTREPGVISLQVHIYANEWVQKEEVSPTTYHLHTTSRRSRRYTGALCHTPVPGPDSSHLRRWTALLCTERHISQLWNCTICCPQYGSLCLHRSTRWKIQIKAPAGFVCTLLLIYGCSNDKWRGNKKCGCNNILLLSFFKKILTNYSIKSRKDALINESGKRGKSQEIQTKHRLQIKNCEGKR